MRDITPLVAPRSIAVIGASANPTKSGGVLFDNLAKGKFPRPALSDQSQRAPRSWGTRPIRRSPTCRRRSTSSTSCCRSSMSRTPSSNASLPARARPASSPPDSPKRAEKGRADEERLREIADAVRPAAGRPQHHRHGQCRGRHDGKLRQFPALGEGRRVVLHADRHLHRRGHAATS